jgi:hypothetical protein
VVAAREPGPPPQAGPGNHFRPAGGAGLTLNPGQGFDAVFGAEHPRGGEAGALQVPEKTVHGR